MQIASQLETAILQCEAIRGRTYLFYNLIARLDARFLPLVFEMEDNFSLHRAQESPWQSRPF